MTCEKKLDGYPLVRPNALPLWRSPGEGLLHGVTLQARVSSLLLLRCVGLRLRLGAERFGGRRSTTHLSGERGRALPVANLHAATSRNGGHVIRDDLNSFL